MMKKFKPYIISIVIALTVGGISALLTASSFERYSLLVKPPLSPPPWLFPIVWSVLFILMGISSAMIYKSENPDKNAALGLYALQLAVNFIWPILFFALEWRFIAFLWILLLVALVSVMILRFYKINKTAALLQLPYLIWIIFATYLNLGVYLLNK